MKVLHIFAELKPSGGETMMRSASDLWLRDAEMHILSTGSAVGSFADTLENSGFIIRHISFEKSMAFAIAVFRLIKAEQYSIVHIHTERASPFYALIARLALGSAVRIVRTVHHIFKFTGVLRFRKILERLVMKRLLSVEIISNSISGQRNEARRFFSRNRLIPNWYDDQYYIPAELEMKSQARQELGLPTNKFIYVSLGGNWYYKNYNKILEALTFFPSGAEVLYVQVGPQGEGAPLEKLARELEIYDKVHCVGSVDDPRAYLYAADGYLMPSSEEGFGVAAVEAMGAGVPAILGNVKALTDFGELVSGIRYVEPEPESIAKEMKWLASLSQRDRYELGKFLAEQVAREFGLRNGPNGYLDLYKELLNEK